MACSFTLAEVARYNMESDPDRMTPLDALALVADWQSRLGFDEESEDAGGEGGRGEGEGSA